MSTNERLDDERVVNAVSHLKQALVLIDESGLTPDIGARLEGILNAIDDQLRNSSDLTTEDGPATKRLRRTEG